MEKEFIIGSDPNCAIVIADPSIQPRHAVLKIDSEGHILPVSGITDVIRSDKSLGPTPGALGAFDIVKIGSIEFEVEDIADGLLFKDPSLKFRFAQNAPTAFRNDSGAHRTIARRSHWKRNFAIAIVALVIGILIYRDREQQLEKLDFIADGVDRIDEQMRSSLADASSIQALRGLLRSYSDEVLMMPDRWVSSQKSGTFNTIVEVGDRLKAYEKRFGLPEGG